MYVLGHEGLVWGLCSVSLNLNKLLVQINFMPLRGQARKSWGDEVSVFSASEKPNSSYRNISPAVGQERIL